MPYVARDAVDKTVNQLEQRDVAFGAAHVLEFIVGKSATGFTQSMTSHSLSSFNSLLLYSLCSLDSCILCLYIIYGWISQELDALLNVKLYALIKCQKR
jgi:hypothetical protein